MQRLSYVVFVPLLAACSAEKPTVLASCGTRPVESSLDPLERGILQESIQRVNQSCGENGEKCHFSIHRFKNEWSVFGQIAPYRDGQCVRVAGGNWIDRYDAEGRFLAHMPGM
jgi:hypothetical protein